MGVASPHYSMWILSIPFILTLYLWLAVLAAGGIVYAVRRLLAGSIVPLAHPLRRLQT